MGAAGVLQRGLVAVALVAALVLGVATPTLTVRHDFHPLSTEQVRQLLRGATVRLLTFGCEVGTRYGTAVATGDGEALTSAHVVDGARIINAWGDRGPLTVATGRTSPAIDVGVVRMGMTTAARLDLSRWDPEPGAPVTMAGFLDDGLQIEPARVVDYVDRGQGEPVMRIDVQPRVGMSGGPVLDAAGGLAGLVFAAEGASGYGLVIPASTVRKTLAGGLLASSGCS